MAQFAPKKLLLGITGGIAAYKAAELVRLLQRENIDVQVAMTEAACRFIAPLTLQALSGRPVLLGLWDSRSGSGMDHIDSSRGHDAVLVAPASADFLAKLAHGLADDLLSTLCLACTCPLLVAPAMNRQMWENPATQRNVARLQGDGIRVLGPASGEQACGETGLGRMLEPPALLTELAALFRPGPLAGKRVLVTAGPTFEAIDAVRGLTNLSSGKMGYAVAQAALEAGAQVTMVSGPTCLAAPAAAKFVSVVSARQMLEAVQREVAASDIFISVAAVADYRVANPSAHKIKKGEGTFTLMLEPTVDILEVVARLPHPPFCVGFAAESENLYEFAQAKRLRKQLPLLAANLVQEALAADESALVLFDDNGAHPLPRAPKITLARQLIAHVAALCAPAATVDREGRA